MGVFFFEEYAKHMWRYYLNSRYAVASMMSGVQLQNWIACDTVFNDLKQSEKDIMVAYGTGGAEAMPEYAKRNRIEQRAIWDVVNKALRMAAEERGLVERADRREAGL